jgi:hypothetical protein
MKFNLIYFHNVSTGNCSKRFWIDLPHFSEASPAADAPEQQINGAKTPGEQKRIPFWSFEGREISFFKLLSYFNATRLERDFAEHGPDFGGTSAEDYAKKHPNCSSDW